MKRKYKEMKEKRMKEDHVFPKCRTLQQPTKKMGCPATIEIKKIAKFPEFELSTTSKTARQRMVGMMRKALENTASPPTADIRYLVYIPSKDEHKFHQIEPMGDSDSLDPLVNEKVLELLASGIRNKKDLAASLKEYVVSTIFHGQEPPIKDRRYFPLASDLAKLISKYKFGKRFAKIDQVNVEKMHQQTDPGDQTFYRYRDSSIENVQVEQKITGGETMVLTSIIHYGVQGLPNDEITMQHDAQIVQPDNCKMTEEFVELEPVDLPLGHSRFESLLITARSALQQITDMTYQFKDNGKLEELSNWVDSIGESLHQAQAFVRREEGLFLEPTSTSTIQAQREHL